MKDFVSQPTFLPDFHFCFPLFPFVSFYNFSFPLFRFPLLLCLLSCFPFLLSAFCFSDFRFSYTVSMKVRSTWLKSRMPTNRMTSVAAAL